MSTLEGFTQIAHWKCNRCDFDTTEKNKAVEHSLNPHKALQCTYCLRIKTAKICPNCARNHFEAV